MANRRNSRNFNSLDVPPDFLLNYSNSFNKPIDLTTENYQSWKINMLYFLDINNLIEYVNNVKITKFKKNKITDLENFIQDKLDPSLVYPKDTNPSVIKKDNLTKWIIMNSLAFKTKKIIESRGNTAFTAWKILENSFTKGKDQRKAEINNYLENMKYDPSVDINVFVATLENLFDDLEKILTTQSNDEFKIGISLTDAYQNPLDL